MSETRRGFFKWLTASTAVASTVHSAVTLPDHNSDKFPQPNVEERLSNFSSRMLDVQDGVIYDRVRLRAGECIPHLLRFFLSPVGHYSVADKRVKGPEHTSMICAGSLPAPNCFLAQQILFAVHPTAHEKDLDFLSSFSMWEFRVGEKIMSRGPVLLNPPAKAYLAQLVDVNAEVKEGRSSRPTRSELPAPVLSSARINRSTGGVFIPSNMYFSLAITHWEDISYLLTGDLDLLIGLQGQEARGVQ